MNQSTHTKISLFFRKTLHILELLIALLTLVVLVGMLGLEIYKMFTVEGYFSVADTFLDNILTIVVGLEFVRMLIDMTPANTIEVLILAMSRQVILGHHEPLSTVASILCIAALFATRRFLIPKEVMQVDLTEAE